MYRKEDPQAQLADMPFAEYIFDAEHPLLRLCDAIDWQELLEGLRRFYSEKQGRPSTPLRAAAGTLMLKHLENRPDRKAVRYVQENIYAQRFCALTPVQAKDYMNPESGLANFRAKIGPEGMVLIEEALHRAAEGKFRRKRGPFAVDTTCVPLDIHYPTDIRLLERCRREVIRLMKEAKALGMEVLYRTYNRTARKLFVSFSKKGKPKKKTRKRVHKKLFQFVRRNLKQLADLRSRATRELGSQCRANPEVWEYLKRLKLAENRIRSVMHQQRLVRRGIVHIPHRIVSFHKPHVRPIVRGKFPLSTEFGPKVLVALVKKCVYVIGCFQGNVADALLTTPSVRWFATRFGRLPRKVLGDRGFYSRWRVRMLKTMGITPGLQQRGRVKAISSQQKRMTRQRLAIEAMISLGKRKFGWDRCRAKNDAHEHSWIGLGAAAMNVHRAFLAQPP